MASSEQLEREAQATRIRIEETLTELRRRVSPGQIADQALDYARDSGGGDFVRHLGRQVVDNPLPVALMGAGLAWLMMTQRRNGEAHEGKGDGSVAMTEPASRNEWNRTVAMATEFEKTSRRAAKKTEPAAEQAKRTGARAYERGNDMAQSAYETSANVASDTYGKASGTASRVYDKASELAGSAYEQAGEAMSRAKDTTAETYDRFRDAAGRSMTSAAESTRGLTRFMRDEPLVVAGLGIALGALVGALLPTTELENRTMGETSDQLKRDTREAVREQWERGKQIAEDGWDEAKEAARRTWEDAKAEAQKSWEATQRDADLPGGGRGDGHAGDKTGVRATLVPSEEETKAEERGQEVRPSS
jgi:ElaB/YqjD/DUF883 family membrane-anchored ribosome-binding protein